MSAPLQLLVVEDSAADRLRIRKLFEQQQDAPRIEMASSAAEGLEALRSRWFDCALLDYLLPDGDAIEMLATLEQEARPVPPTLVVTSRGNERVAASVFKGGACDYLPKEDLTPDLLRNAVENAVRQRRQASRLASARRPPAVEFEELLRELLEAAGEKLQPPIRSVNEMMRKLHVELIDADRNLNDLVEKLRGESFRAHRLIRDLLRFARLRANEAGACSLDPADAIEIAAFSYEEQLAEPGALVVGPLPRVRATPQQLVDLFRALLDNSVTHRGDHPLRVRISGERSGAMATLTIEDEGPGIPAEWSDRVFGLFQRMGSDDSYTGTGLGLALARRITQMHGGLIWSEPQPTGARIRFTLPADEAPTVH